MAPPAAPPFAAEPLLPAAPPVCVPAAPDEPPLVEGAPARLPPFEVPPPAPPEGGAPEVEAGVPPAPDKPPLGLLLPPPVDAVPPLVAPAPASDGLPPFVVTGAPLLPAIGEGLVAPPAETPPVPPGDEGTSALHAASTPAAQIGASALTRRGAARKGRRSFPWSPFMTRAQ